MDSTQLLQHLATTLSRPGAASLTAAMAELISNGSLDAGLKLPPVRDIAAAVEASPSLVGLSWQTLRTRGLIETRTRGGTTVIGPPQPAHPRRFLALGDATDGVIDIGRPAPDPALLPDLGAALDAVAREPDLNSADPPPITAALHDAAAASWPYPTPRLLAVHRGIDGIEQTLLALTGPGQVVAVEDPTVPRILDILDRLGVRAVPVAWRGGGPDLRELARAGRAGASLFVYQPQGHSPTGQSVTPDWLDQATRLLERTGMLALELDGFPLLRTVPRSLGATAPQSTILVRGYTHSHGPDVQVAVLGGPTPIVDRIEQGVAYTHRWVSRVLQDALAFMLTDPAVAAQVARASELYRARFDEARSWFADRGMPAPDAATAPCLWLPVADDALVVARLREAGVGVLAGRNFARRVGARAHVHVNASFGVDAVAAQLRSVVAVAAQVADEQRAQRRARTTS